MLYSKFAYFRNDMRKIGLILLGLGAVVLLAFIYPGYTPQDDNEQKNELLIKLIMEGLSQGHYQPQNVNNEFSKKVFNQYLKKLDYNKRFLTRRDHADLKKYQYLIDDELRNGTYLFFNYSFEMMVERIADAKSYYKEILDQPFDFNKQETIELDFDKIYYSSDKQELKEKWRKLVKYQTLTKLYELTDINDTGSDPTATPKSQEQLEVKARENTIKIFDRWFERLEKIEKRDRLIEYINAVASIFDPHTVYYAPKQKEDFDISFSGRLEGIGARLTEKDGFIAVAQIVPGSASWLQGDLEAGDKILKVAQADQEPVDIVGMRIDDAIRMIRGKKGTEVRLTVKKIDGMVKVIPIIRDVIIFEQTYAKSAVLNYNQRIGYIKLPTFYADFSGNGGRSCAQDVKTEIIKLKGEAIQGLILDLRNNGGGSLADVVEMAGLFIEKGPIVQVKPRRGAPVVLEDKDPSIVYNGPLVIMVNSFSASASEIMVAAMQDYDRAIIIGSGATTFGKGTVQRIMDIDNFLTGHEELKPLGSILMTTQKFYRIDGTTNQLKGVVPDIVLPSSYSYIDHGEKDLEYPIPWDEITPAAYNKWNKRQNKEGVIELSELRVQNNPKFSLVNENALRLKNQQDKTVFTLNLGKYIQERENIKKEAEKYEDIVSKILGLTINSLPLDQLAEQQDSTKMARTKTLHNSLMKDIYLQEALTVITQLQ